MATFGHITLSNSSSTLSMEPISVGTIMSEEEQFSVKARLYIHDIVEAHCFRITGSDIEQSCNKYV